MWQFYGLQPCYFRNISLTSLANKGGGIPLLFLRLELMSLTVVNKAEQMHIGSDYMASIPQYTDKKEN